MLVNLSEIKQLVNRVSEKIQNDIEVSGMEGDFDYVEYLQSELDTINRVSTELKGYQNSNLSIPFLLNSLKVATPSLDLTQLVIELETLIQVKEQELQEIKKSITKDKMLLDKLKDSLTDPKELPSTTK